MDKKEREKLELVKINYNRLTNDCMHPLDLTFRQHELLMVMAEYLIDKLEEKPKTKKKTED